MFTIWLYCHRRKAQYCNVLGKNCQSKLHTFFWCAIGSRGKLGITYQIIVYVCPILEPYTHDICDFSHYLSSVEQLFTAATKMAQKRYLKDWFCRHQKQVESQWRTIKRFFSAEDLPKGWETSKAEQRRWWTSINDGASQTSPKNSKKL